MLAALEKPDAWISSPTAKYSVKSTDPPVVNLSVDWVAEISVFVKVLKTSGPLKFPAPKPDPGSAVSFPGTKPDGVISAADPDRLVKI